MADNPKYQVESSTLKHSYQAWRLQATEGEIRFVDSVYLMCERNYARGGDTIVECWCPTDILDPDSGFHSLEDVKKFCGIKLEQATNHRWGEDDDPAIQAIRRFDNWL